MYLLVSAIDYARLRPETRADLLSCLSLPVPTDLSEPSPSVTQEPLPVFEDFDMEDVVDLTPDDIARFVDGIHQQTIAGLRVFAEHGPVIDAHLLDAAGITNYSHFQGRVTKRTRTITGKKHAYLFAWDEWQWDNGTTLRSGRYAVTPETYRSLRQFFGL